MSERKPLVFEGSSREFYEAEDGTIYCDRRSCPGSKGLRDHRNGVPICAKCAVRTAVGYISKDTAREHQNIFFNASPGDYIIAGMTAFIISSIAGFILSQFWFFLVFLLAAPAGGVVSEAVFRVLRKRRGRYTGQVVGGAMSLSAVILAFAFLTGMTSGNILSLAIYAFIAIGVAVSRFQLGLRF